MNYQVKLSQVVVWLGLLWPMVTQADMTYISLDYPNARQTKPTCIDANGISGSYVDNS